MYKKSHVSQYVPNNMNQNSLFKDGDFKNHILNEKNIPITENFLNKIFKKYDFNHNVLNLSNFQTAMTHVSYLDKKIIPEKTAKIIKDVKPISSENRKRAMHLQQKDYNTLEYYGDSVIHLALTQYLYHRYPNKDSGFLTKLRTKLEKAESLSFLSKCIGLHKYVVIARNMEYTNAREIDPKLTEDIFESFICALFLESSYTKCQDFIVSLIEKEIDFAELLDTDDNYKEKIMQYFHKLKLKDPKYIENKEAKKNGTSCHDQEFVVYVFNQDENSIIGVGTGNTKTKAEQNAAHDALIKLGVIKDYDNCSDYYYESEDEYYDKKTNNKDCCEKNNSDENDSDEDYYTEDNSKELEWKSWFKDEDYRNHMLNENNIYISDNFINNILEKYGLNYKITDKKTFQIAMTHISYLDKITLKEKTALLLKDIPPISNEKKKNTIFLQKEDNSRLGHLGNAVIHLALTEYICKRYSNKNQGFLTKLRTKLERAETLSELAKTINLHKYAIIARNMELNGARIKEDSLLKSLFEGFIGALFLELKYEDCREFLINLFERNVDFAELLNTDDNYKEKIMQHFHIMMWKEPQYCDKENSESISEDNQREFTIYVKNIEGKILGTGVGNTKNKAEQNAAYNALIYLGVIENKEEESDYYGELSDDENNENNESDYYEE